KKGELLYEDACKSLELLKNKTDYKSKNQKKYMEGGIFPVMSVYQALQKSGQSKAKAYEHMKKMIGENTRKHTRKMWTRLGKLPFFFSLFRMMFSKGLEGDSWDVLWVSNDKSKFEYNIQRCLWHDTFSEYGCPELCAIFCHNDEINFTNVSKYLRFNRENALGYGGECCDFHFYSNK
ncbi:MAG TPA: L-2-amino-thiazoline-4-carboxylic acid hydrolase, partial [Clostridia bacterium]|nr:L-2-amino-thiazoline-4-carboxylic acid hydrolase [Clostridia bacterium]